MRERGKRGREGEGKRERGEERERERECKGAPPHPVLTIAQ